MEEQRNNANGDGPAEGPREPKFQITHLELRILEDVYASLCQLYNLFVGVVCLSGELGNGPSQACSSGVFPQCCCIPIHTWRADPRDLMAIAGSSCYQQASSSFCVHSCSILVIDIKL
ncbi:uncharacterized protein LOC127808862 isoform X1 [Diospyros lotus]|uniref:uncharacterized protein LOC127808862 isoform X1 n=1 Tax=Diospyros lotus TaxID=55363 RepID=UPI002250DD2C|nr:uncharacterized protein LOC127808862 isoform X1 [Diospyros lotus]